MRGFVAFFKKELLEYRRSGKLLLFGILFFLFGVMNPAIAKLTPWMLEMLAEEMAQSGMSISTVEPDAMMSWTQFFKNIPVALIVFVLVVCNTFTKEYTSGTLVLLLTKGLARSRVLLAKACTMILLWTAGYWLCFATTWTYTAYYWDNSSVQNLLPAVLHWYLFGLLCTCLVVLFSVISSSSTTVALLTGGTLLASYLAGLLPRLKHVVPTALMNSTNLLLQVDTPTDYLPALVLTLALGITGLLLSIPLFNRKTI